MRKEFKIFFILVSIFGFSCQKDEFSPIGDFNSKLVVFGILDSRLNTQLFKVQGNYLFDQGVMVTNPDKIPNNIKITISNGNKSYVLKDTVIPDVTNYRVYYNKDFNLIRGLTYSLIATCDGYPTLTSNVQVPSEQYVMINFSYTDINVSYGAHEFAKGYLYHMYLNYSLLVDKVITKTTRIEIPTSFSISDVNINDTSMTYPILTRSKSAKYPRDALIYTLLKIKPSSENEQIKINGCVVEVLSFDPNLYNYYQTVKGFSDPYSIRLDKPFYTNINNGYGIFGAITLDTNTFKIPGDILEVFEYIDGQ